MANDEQRWSHWMGQAQKGDEQAYNLLLTEISQAITAYLRARFGSEEIVEDCVQECLIAIHNARHTYNTKRLFRPWLFALVRHKAIDMLRKNNNYKSMLERSYISGNTDSYTMQEMEHGSIFAALKPAHREALTLTKIIGLSIAEAANQLEISESALKVRVHRAIKATRKILDAERDEA